MDRLAHFAGMPPGMRHRSGPGPAGVADTTVQTGAKRASGQAEYRPERTVGDVVVEVLVQRRDDRGASPQPYVGFGAGHPTDHNSALIAMATRTGPERTPLLPEVRTAPATGRGGAGIPRPRRSE